MYKPIVTKEENLTRSQLFAEQAKDIAAAMRSVGAKEDLVAKIEARAKDCEKAIAGRDESYWAARESRAAFRQAVADAVRTVSEVEDRAGLDAALRGSAKLGFALGARSFLRSVFGGKETEYHYDTKTGHLEYAFGPNGEIVFFDKSGEVTRVVHHALGLMSIFNPLVNYGPFTAFYEGGQMVGIRSVNNGTLELSKDGTPVTFDRSVHERTSNGVFRANWHVKFNKAGMAESYNYKAEGEHPDHTKHLVAEVSVKYGKDPQDVVIAIKENPLRVFSNRSGTYTSGTPGYAGALAYISDRLNRVQIRIDRLMRKKLELDRFVQEVQAKVREGEVPKTGGFTTKP